MGVVSYVVWLGAVLSIVGNSMPIEATSPEAEKAIATDGLCVNDRSTFQDNSMSGWVATNAGEAYVESKEGRDHVLALKRENVDLSTTFPADALSIYNLGFDLYG